MFIPNSDFEIISRIRFVVLCWHPKQIIWRTFKTDLFKKIKSLQNADNWAQFYCNRQVVSSIFLYFLTRVQHTVSYYSAYYEANAMSSK